MNRLINLEERIQKYRQFYSDPTPGQIMAVICYAIPVEFDTGYKTSKRLDQWDFSTENRAYVEDEIKKINYCLDLRKELQDDYIPCAMVMYGVGVFGAYFTDGQVIFGDETSWMHQVMHSWDDLGKIREGLEYVKKTGDNYWFQKISEVNRYYTELNEENYLVTPFTHWGPLDMANGIRGNDILYDFYDHPDETKELLDICADATIFLQKEQRKIVGDTMGGLPIWVTWVPGNSVFMSSDLADMISPQLFETFGIPAMQKVMDAFEGGMVHHHSVGLKAQKGIAKLRNMKLFEMTLDQGTERPLDHLEELFDWCRGVPILTRCTAEEVYRKIDSLKKGKTILRVEVNSIEDGKEVLKFIRKNSII